MNTLLVYGTLRKFHRNNRILGESHHLETVMVPDWAMFDLGAFPGVKKCKGSSIRCEVYLVSDQRLRALDTYEGYHPDRPKESLFVRRPCHIHNHDTGLLRAMGSDLPPWGLIYEYAGAVDMMKRIECGDYERYLTEKKGD